MTFEEWMRKAFYLDKNRPVYDDALTRMFRDAWDAATQAERERCARVAEQAGWDTQQERAQGKYVAERIRDGDKPL